MEPFSIPIQLLLSLLGVCAGFFAGLLGIGGGIILVPLFLALFKVFHYPPELIVHAAFGTSLAIVMPTSLTSTWSHRKHGNVSWTHVGPLAAGGVAGAFFGGFLAAMVPGVWLKGCYGLMLLVVGGSMFIKASYLPPERSTPVPLRQLLLVGSVTGGFAAFFGGGGGIVAVPMMVYFLHLPAQLAVGNSSALVVVSAVAGTASYILHGWQLPGLPAYSLGYVNLMVMLLVTPSAMIGARFGAKMAGRVSHDRLINIFAILLLLIGARVLYVTFF